MFDEGVDRSDWKTISDSAQRRLDDAIKKFDNETSGDKDFTAYTSVLNPDEHLTGETWKLFKKYAESKGYDAKRVKATDDERKQFKVQRQSAVYFVQVRTKKDKGAKKRKNEDEQGEQKPKRTTRSKK